VSIIVEIYCSSSTNQVTHDGISGVGNVDGMLVTIVRLGLLRRTLPGGVGAGRSGTDVAELRPLPATARWLMLHHTHTHTRTRMHATTSCTKIHLFIML